MYRKQGRQRPLDTPKRMIEKEGEREKERQKERYREGGRDKRERERERGERDREVKGAQSKHNPSPNAFPKLCEWFSG